MDAILVTIDCSKRDQGRASYTTRTMIADISPKHPKVLCVMFTDIEEAGWQYRMHREAQSVSQRTNVSSSEHAYYQDFSDAVRPLQGSHHEVRESSWQLGKRRETFASTRKPLVSRIWSEWVSSLCIMNQSPVMFTKISVQLWESLW